MIYQVEKDAEEFEFWGGAERFMDECEKLGVADEVYRLLDDMFSDEHDVPTATAINDYVWFETDDICGQLWDITEDDFWEGGEAAQETAE